MLDAYQSVGTVPVDVKELGCSFLIGGTLKWLCGGPGGAFLYVRDDLIDTLAPTFTGWMAHPEPFAFEGPPMRYTTGAYRWMNGTPNVPALYACRAGPEDHPRGGCRGDPRQEPAPDASASSRRGSREGWDVRAPMDPAQPRRHGGLRRARTPST